MGRNNLEYTLTYRIRGKSEPVVEMFTGETLDFVLKQLFKKCNSEDQTGVFFELENADVNALEEQGNFYKITVDECEYGIIIEDVQVESPIMKFVSESM